MKLKHLLFGPATLLMTNKKVQSKQEEIAHNINPKLGEKVEKTNRMINSVVDNTEKLAHTTINALDSSLPLRNVIRKYFSAEVTELYQGDHLYVQRSVYTHHGLYYGEDKVIHYLKGSVTIDSLEKFADGSKILRNSELVSPASFSRSEIIRRSESRLGENKYNLMFNNCEHFVRWCRNG